MPHKLTEQAVTLVLSCGFNMFTLPFKPVLGLFYLLNPTAHVIIILIIIVSVILIIVFYFLFDCTLFYFFFLPVTFVNFCLFVCVLLPIFQC